MALTIGAVLCLLVLGLIGLVHGIRRGLVAIAGTLLGVILVGLWQERWLNWLNETMALERPAWPEFLLVAAIFLSVSALIGYGGGMLMPPGKPIANQTLDRLLGGLIGAINGALIVGYLLRYASTIWPETTITPLIDESALAGILALWLPWFILTLVGVTGLFVLIRLTTRVARLVNARRALAASAGAAKGPAGAGSASGSVAASRSLGEADKKLNEKINQRLGQ